jgi:hypothetical protein
VFIWGTTPKKLLEEFQQDSCSGAAAQRETNGHKHQTILFINNFIVQCKNYKGGASFRL